MRIREAIARRLAPGLMDEAQVKSLVSEEVRRAAQARPVNLDYDPHGEGYRRITREGQMERQRDLSPMSQDLMFELAYWMYDRSGLVKRFVRDTRNFMLGKGISWEVADDPDGKAQDVLDRFWADRMNRLDLRLGKRMEFLCLLGEQCWPVSVNPHNGRVWLSYIDPSNIEDAYTLRFNPEIVTAVKLKGISGRTGEQLSAIREEMDPRRPEAGRLVGQCFFFSINNPPNSPRGRSDIIHLFDIINNMEERLFDELDRMGLTKAFVWDVTLNGATEEEIKAFLRDNKTPKPGSVRAHNEQVTWSAVAPDLKQSDSKAFFEYVKSYLAACQNRPASWLGEGGKAYQTEADLMGEPTFMDLEERQNVLKYMLEDVFCFVLDQATLAGALRPPQGKGGAPAPGWEVAVSMPQMKSRDTQKLSNSLSTLATGLMLAENQKWVQRETASRIFLMMAQELGVEVDPEAEIEALAAVAEKLKTAGQDGVTKDYEDKEPPDLE